MGEEEIRNRGGAEIVDIDALIEAESGEGRDEEDHMDMTRVSGEIVE